MADKRKFIRRPAPGEFAVKDRTKNELIGLTKNLSIKGIRIITDKKYPVPSYIWCQIELPEKVDGEDYFEFDAEIKWCQKSIMAGFFEIGCEIRNLSKTDQKIIKAITHLWMMKQSDDININRILVKKN
ncbi:MAG: PilZ domain-containing protein [Candidatus Zixiibacteriota bacterium]